ncbi:MAG: 2-dehydro-3-deoxyphosphogluconate aldolase/(4S)-4-hydroxy-2-oxoglutarate aldolase [Myxococcota bacterium]|jgi:2-dehydro-3-deoxyphosphogluconate aldolase/(4S)-4-hydroxy-2-oxoglutarate aldolase
MVDPHTDRSPPDLSIASVIASSPIVPVLTLRGTHDPIGLARTLVESGVPIMEVTLRTAEALEMVRRVRDSVPEMIVGVGTALNCGDLDRSLAAGALFAVSPGLTESMVRHAQEIGLPFLPGVSTASELMMARDLGLRIVKFFPAESVGGAKMLRRLAPVFSDMTFVPTGGIGPHNVADYRALSNVVAVGGSWIVPSAALEAADWSAIASLAKAAIE